jgi:hypothetical protein
MEPVFRLFIDEVGHANMKSAENPNQRYLSLTGVMMRLSHEQGEFKQRLDALKVGTFGSADVVLHRSAIVYHEPPFECLEDEKTRNAFDAELLTLLRDTSYRVVTVVIDKLEHQRRYVVWQAHPYHYCLKALLERYVLWLQAAQRCGDVMAESRGKKDNKKLCASYARLYQQGTDYVGYKTFQRWLSTKELKIKEKAANIGGLQLADLIANPSMRSLVCERSGTEMTAEFGKRVVEVLKKHKYRRRYDGMINGIGTKWLP